MNNLAISLKKFFTNKNTVTILGVVAILVILFFMYTKTIDDKIKEVSVPVAAKTINPQTEITTEDVTTIQIASAAKPDDSKIATNEGEIIGKYTGVGVTVPEGSMFYKDLIVEKEELPGNWIRQLQIDEATQKMPIPYQLETDVEKTYGNSIQPGDYIDIYIKTIDEKNQLIFGKMIENLKVESVTDGEGNEVFRSQTDIGEPAHLNFGLSEDFFDVFKKAEYITGIDLEIIVVPHGGMPTEEKLATRVTAEALRGIIINRAAKVEQDPVETTTNNAGTDSTTTTDGNTETVETVNP